jgi:hypothetical protein
MFWVVIGSWGGVDRFGHVGWVTDGVIAGWPPCGHGRVAGERVRAEGGG